MAAQYINRKYGGISSDVTCVDPCLEISFNMECPTTTTKRTASSVSRGASRARSIAPSESSSSLYRSHSAPQRGSIVNNIYDPADSLRSSVTPPHLMTPEEEAYRRRSLSRAKSPLVTPSYSEALIKTSRRLRAKALTPPPPEITPSTPTTINLRNAPPSSPRLNLRARSNSGSRSSSSSKPPLPHHKNPEPRVVASNFYRGKVKSIYEREPLFQDFVRDLPETTKKSGLYNASQINEMKNNFRGMIECKYKQMSFGDPGVGANIGSKLLPWKDSVVRDREPASTRIQRIQESRPRLSTPTPLPKLTVYHRSTYAT